VRFAEPNAVHRLVSRAVREALGARRWIAVPAPPAAPGGGAPGSEARALRDAPAEASDWIFAGRPAARAPAPAAEQAAAEPDGGPRLRLADLPLLGQLLATYLLVEAPDGLVLVDQHAAHERVLFERLRAAWRERAVARQALLLPATVELPPERAARLAEADLERIGFDVEPFGAGVFVVRAIPAELAGEDPAALLCNVADQIDPEAGDLRAPEAVDRLFASLACHAARRAGDRLAPGEQHALLAALDTIPWAPTCPHGRPVAIPITRGELERRFRRA
jgi:DNA mismatch repair protein MutL